MSTEAILIAALRQLLKMTDRKDVRYAIIREALRKAERGAT
jgi:hypothetical protein